jgi:hypothetical protein
VAPRPGSDVHVETDALREYSHHVYGQSGDFGDSWINKGDWASAAEAEQTTHSDAGGPADSGPLAFGTLPASRTFWGSHVHLVNDLAHFKVQLGLSLQAIAAASGAIVHAYESSDQVSADRITNQSSFFRGDEDARPGTLEHARRVYQRKQAGRGGK